MAPQALQNASTTSVLGLDTRMPQKYTEEPEYRSSPAQDEYPVWYFLYENSVGLEELQRRLHLADLPVYSGASVEGGRIKQYRGKYGALVDADEESTQNGKAYLIPSKEREDVLRLYMTARYEVVRCRIWVAEKEIPGLTFRFASSKEGLAR